MSEIEVFNPVAETVKAHVAPAVRPTDLAGKRIGLYWNYKSGGDLALAHVKELLGKRYPDARFEEFVADVGFTVKYGTEKLADRVASACDVVVGTTAD